MDSYTKLLNHSLLSREKTNELIKEYQDTDDPYVKRRIEEKLIRHNFKYIYKLAAKFAWKHKLEIDDCVNEASMAVIKTLNNFDLSKGYAYLTYFTWWVKSALQRYYQRTKRTIKLPAHIQELYIRIRKYIKEYSNTQGKDPSLSQIAQELDVSIEKVRLCLQCHRKLTSLNLRPTTNDDTNELISIISCDKYITPFQSAEQSYLRDAVDSLLDTLSPRDKHILTLYYGFNSDKRHSLQTIADKYNCSRETIRARVSRSIRTLRAQSDFYHLSQFLTS